MHHILFSIIRVYHFHLTNNITKAQDFASNIDKNTAITITKTGDF